MTVKNLNQDNFEDFIDKGNTIIDFYADWCGPCQMIKPVFEELSNEYNDVEFGRVDTENNSELASKFGIMSIPCLVVLKDGNEVNRILGYMPKEQLKQRIDNIIGG